jgi:glycosyltransferase involved in cell wall biosynthesis
MITDKYSISLFFPCYNEEANVETQTLKSIDVLSSVTDDYEVIIVNDGSKDRTREIADSLVQQYPTEVKVIHHPTNLGYGAALQSGFRAASKNLVFYTDGDGQFDISEMPALLKFIPEFDIVSCYRLNRQDGFMRKVNAFCWGTLGNILFRFGLRDVDCAFKLYKREIFDNIKMQSTGALIDTEILARAKRKGYKIKQVGVHHYPRAAGTQTGAKISVILRAFRELFVLYRQIIKDA